MMDLANVITFVIVGFVAQMIDGALGMAYGVSSTTFLLSVGVPPAAASASIHIAEIFISGVSGLSHLRLGNVDSRLLKRLVVPGVVGGILGAYLLTSIPGDKIGLFISIYLLVMGLMILWKALRAQQSHKETESRLIPLGLIGGFFDATGGGGWGPIVTSTLVAQGHNPRSAIGSVNLTEFFVTVAESATFVAIMGVVHWQIILGLIIGGVLAAPLAAYVCQRLPARTLMLILGTLIICLSMRSIYIALCPS